MAQALKLAPRWPLLGAVSARGRIRGVFAGLLDMVRAKTPAPAPRKRGPS